MENLIMCEVNIVLYSIWWYVESVWQDSLEDYTIWLDLILVCFEGWIMIIYKLKFVAVWNATYLFWYQITKHLTTMDSIKIFKIYDIRTIFAMYLCNTQYW